MLQGVALGFLTYALFSMADALVKSLGGELPVMEIVFLGQGAAFAVILILRPRGEQWRDMFRMRHPKRVILRAACGVTAAVFSTFAFTTIPLAEAYSLIFLAPVFVTVMSIPLLGEKVGWRRISAVAIGLLGVVLVVKPGFRELHFGHLAALICAVAGATSMIILRMIGHSERRVSLVGMLMLSIFVVSGTLMIPVFVVPSGNALLKIALFGVLAGVGQYTMLAATRAAPANRVAPAQYSQIVWAVVFGALFFAEFPDWIALIGIGMIGLSGLFTLLREDKVSGWPRRVPLVRTRF
ncbi:MAG: DMT family transporter [Rhizobiales bacterium]|jgi:S-adenosylmethionine uptake transporter|nr:DMT family transporter [Hyphomicrobiales bacterium]